MTKEERLLRWKTGRTRFSEEELLEARRVMSRDSNKDESAGRLPSKFIPVGGLVDIFGHIYKCVEASGPHKLDACYGCDIAKSENCTFRVPQCSPFDRSDHKRVWFVRAVRDL